MEEIRKRLMELKESDFKEFNSSLIPTTDKASFIGVRTPALRKMAKEVMKSGMAGEFMNELPHTYFEENQLHGFLIELIKDYDECIIEIERFLPYVDNWATCDQMNPRILKKYPDSLENKIVEWMKSDHVYTVRFAIKLLMNFYLEDQFDEKYLKMVASVESDEYYINMMIAWYFATALAKQYEVTVPYIEQHILSDWIHRKTIQKACESFRVSDDHKIYLKSFR